MRSNFLRTSIALAIVSTLFAPELLAQTEQGRVWVSSFPKKYPFNEQGTLKIENRAGRVWVEAHDKPELTVSAKLTVRGRDDEALKHAKETLIVRFHGNRDDRFIGFRNWEAGSRMGWSAELDLRIKAPVGANISVSGGFGELVSISGIKGQIAVNTFKGDVVIREPEGSIVARSINGDVSCEIGTTPKGSIKLSSVNGAVNFRAVDGAAFRWEAETLNGSIRAPRFVGGNFDTARPTMFRATVGSVSAAQRAALPRVLTASSSGDVTLWVGPESTPVARTAPQTTGPEDLREHYRLVRQSLPVAPSAREFAVGRGRSSGNVTFETRIGNVFLGRHEGSARIRTGGGEIVAGTIIGDLAAATLGGPIHVVQVSGTMDLDTGAGDVWVVSNQGGGSARTGGGNISIRRIAGPVTLSSAGGDIRVDQAFGKVDAFTRSGDIQIGFGQQSRPGGTRLETKEGNVVLKLPATLQAQVDVTIYVDDEMSNAFVSSFEGLSVVRDRHEGRGRIRAFGSLNGGGPRVQITATSGQVHLLSP